MKMDRIITKTRQKPDKKKVETVRNPKEEADLWWSRLGSNQRPSACEADALPLSHGTGGHTWRWRLTEDEDYHAGIFPLNTIAGANEHRDLCRFASVDYCQTSQWATISPTARGCSAVGSASPCQGEGRGFESRHPLERCEQASNPNGGVAEW